MCSGADAAGADTEEGDWNHCGDCSHPPGTAVAKGTAAAAFVTDVLTVPKSPVAAAAASPKIEVAAAAACPKPAAFAGLLPVPSDPFGTRAAAFDCPAPSLLIRIQRRVHAVFSKKVKSRTLIRILRH